MTWWWLLPCGATAAALGVGLWLHQRTLRRRAYLMQEAIRNRDFTFRLPAGGLLPGERAMQDALAQLATAVRQLTARSEVEAWERMARVLTHEVMNATAPIVSLSQTLADRPDVRGTALVEGLTAIHDASLHLSELVAAYRKLTELDRPTHEAVDLRATTEALAAAYQGLRWVNDVPAGATVTADATMLRQVLLGLVQNATEAGAQTLHLALRAPRPAAGSAALPAPPAGPAPADASLAELTVSNDGRPIPAEARRSLFVPLFTTKRGGHGIGLPLGRRMMALQNGMLDLADSPVHGYAVTFVVSLPWG